MLTLKFFADAADRVGTRQLQAPHHPSPTALLEAVAQLSPLKKYPQLRVAVNRQWADWSTPLRDGDEVAFLPPVSGG